MAGRNESNRKNALKSTGPRTPEGKAVVAQNALKHGLLSRETVLCDENRPAFRSFANGLLEELQPTGAMECLLVDRIIAAGWRLRRVHVVEAELFSCAYLKSFGERYCANAESFQTLSRYEAAIERSFFRALSELERLQTRRSGRGVAPPSALEIGFTAEQKGILTDK